MNLYSENRFHS